MDAGDLMDLYATDDAVARARADAMAQRARALQGAGLMVDSLTGGRLRAGQALTGMGQHESDQIAQAIKARPEAIAQNIAAKRAQEEQAAWKDPASATLLRGAIQQFMPNLPLDENTPVPVLRNIAPMAEKYGQSISALNARAALHGLQDKYDPVTGNHYKFDPITGATYRLDGSILTPAIRGFPGPNAQPAGVPTPAGLGAPATQPKPRLLGAPPTPGGNGGVPGSGAGSLEPLSSDKRIPKFSEDLKKDLDAASASARSTFGSASNIIFRGARIMPLLLQKNADGTPRNPTTQEWQDISAALVAMQTNGVPPEQMTLNAMPRDAAGSAASMMQWLTAAPHAPDRQEWVKRFVDNIAREEEAAKKQIHDTQLQRLGAHSDFASVAPNRMKQLIRSYGLDPASVDQIRAGTYGTQAAAPAPEPAPRSAAALTTQDQQAKAWADANPSDPRAKAILEKLKARGL